MPTNSDNDRYPVNTPHGGDGYDVEHNNNFDSLATDVPKTGPVSQRPEAIADFAPEFYFATDEEILYWNAGTIWKDLSAISDGGGAATSSARRGIGPGGRDDLHVYPGAGPGFAFESMFNSTAGDTEAVKYHDGDVYTTTDVAAGESATIERYDTNGSLIDSFTASEINHPNSFAFFDGYLWVGEADPPNSSNATVGVVIDWESKSVVKEIAFDGPALDQQLRCVVPTSDGQPKFLFTEFDFDSDNVAEGAIVDPQGTFDAGATNGNVDVTFDADWLTRIQAAEWLDGHLYATAHMAISKHRFPYADQIRTGYTPGSSTVWFHPRPNYSGSQLFDLEQPTYNPVDDIWYVNANGGTYQCREIAGERRLGQWGQWNYQQGVGVGANTALELDESVANGPGEVDVFAIAKPAIVEVWFRDDGVDGMSYCTVLDDADNQQSIGFETAVSASNYVLDGSGQSKTDTGIARPSSATWVRFRWILRGDRSQQFISTDGGTTWQSAGEVTAGANALATLRTMVDAGVSSIPLVGEWTIRLIR